jgi:hypothetical protein
MGELTTGTREPQKKRLRKIQRNIPLLCISVPPINFSNGSHDEERLVLPVVIFLAFRQLLRRFLDLDLKQFHLEDQR